MTGTHLIQNPKNKRFIPVEDMEESELSQKSSNIMSCLITSNHRIPIGEYTFWDWEDDKKTLDKWL